MGTERESRPSVLVLSTLHEYHAQVPCYSFAALAAILERLAPDLVMLEVADEDLQLRRDERIKREYPEVVYPLLARGVLAQARAMEPSGSVRAALIARIRAAAAAFENTPEGAAYQESVLRWLRELMSSWRSPADANSRATDDAVAAKKAGQNSLYPPDYSRCWDEWNEHFLARIVEAVHASRPALAVVLVGLEHSYWLRPRLAGRSDMTLLDAATTLASVAPPATREEGSHG